MPDPFSWIARFYDRLAGRPDTAAYQRLLALPPGGRLLDLGGGTGRISQTFTDAQVVLCDMAVGMLLEARKKGLRVCQGPAEALPFADCTFDGVLVVDALHHFGDQQRALGEMLRVLRPAGRLLVVEPDIRRSLMPLLSWAERRMGLSSRMLPPEQLRALLTEMGSPVLTVEEDGFSYRLLAGRPG